MENNENFVEQTENVEQTTEETVAEQTFTQADVDRMVKEKLDEVMPGKIARREAKIRKENDRKYGDLVEVLKAGMGKEDIGEITEDLRSFYGNKKGIKMPEKPNYTQQDIEVLAQADVAEIMRGGFDEVVEEADRLNAIGFDRMTARDKAVFVALTNHIKDAEAIRELEQIGVTEDVYNSPEFKKFSGMFNSSAPITEVYKMYAKTVKPQVEPIGSMKNGSHDEGKTFYTPEEVDKLTPKDLDNPVIFQRVRDSMKLWK